MSFLQDLWKTGLEEFNEHCGVMGVGFITGTLGKPLVALLEDFTSGRKRLSLLLTSTFLDHIYFSNTLASFHYRCFN